MSRSTSTLKQTGVLLAGPVGLLLLCLWAMVSTRGGGTGAAPPGPLAGTLVLVLFLVTFSGMTLNLVHRLTAVAAGAVGALLLGSLLGFYYPPDALRFLWAGRTPLVLLAGLSLVTELLQESGLFAVLAQRAVIASGGDRVRAMLLLCGLTYLLSMVVNNLTTIMVIIPVTLRICRSLELDPVPVVVGEIIASNLGGASTMIGDFPNMLIASQAGQPFHRFLIYLAPVCLLQLALLMVVLANQRTTGGPGARRVRALLRELGRERLNRDIAYRGLLILGGMLVAFSFCGFWGLSPALVALVGGHLAMFAGGVPWKTLVQRICARDIVFFACLFLMVGAVSASGILDGVGVALSGVWRSSPRLGLLVVLWCAALLTAVLNAGPTTALLLHLLSAAHGAPQAGPIIWWALSLGVCAGSCGTLTGATAGPVTATILERNGYSLSFNRYARTGLPLMLLFLVVSSAFLLLVPGGG